MKPVIECCKPRTEVLKGELQDAIFAADFGHVIENAAPKVYQDPETFFRNTHPADPLKKLVTNIFDRLASTDESGAVIRLSTGYGGGKTHTLIALWHLAHNIEKTHLGTDLLPAAGRPERVAVAGIDGDKAGTEVFLRHRDIVTHSLWGELAYQLGGATNYEKVRGVDNPETVPDAGLIREILPKDTPVLILLDEIVLYMLKLNEHCYKALLAFLNALISVVRGRKQAVLVVTDPGQEVATQRQAGDLERLVSTQEAGEVEKALGDTLGRIATDFDPIGDESAQVIIRRLFEQRDEDAASETSAEYFKAYQRISEQIPNALPPNLNSKEYANRIVTCYPFHPRMLDTAKDRLGAIQDFQKSRGVLRLFARIIRDVWESGSNIPLITAGDLDWSSERIRADLLSRLNRDNFAAAVDADVLGHAVELDKTYSTDIHRRVASALLLESLAPQGCMDRRDVTLAVVRPDEVGHEPGEALDRLMSVCWHTKKNETGDKFYFHYEPNVNKLIEETMEKISVADARQAVFTAVQNYFSGQIFELKAYPSKPREVPDTIKLKLVLAESEELAQRICDYEDDSEPNAERPRRFRNAIFAVAPSPDELDRAIRDQRRYIAAQQVIKDYVSNKSIKKQVEEILPTLEKRASIGASKAFRKVVFQGRSPVSLEEKYLVDESMQQYRNGQQNLKNFLDDNKLVYQAGEAIDVDLLLEEVIPGATPSLDHEGAFLASSIYERALSSPRLRLMMDGSPVRNSIINAVQNGKLVVRLPNGDVHDSKGRVTGPEGNRTRKQGEPLQNLPLERDVLVAPIDAPCVQDWLKVDEDDTSREVQPSPEPSTIEIPTVTAYNWQKAIEYSETRPLTKLELKATTPEAADKLLNLAQPFGASSKALKLTLSGNLKDGGEVRFTVNDAKINCSIKPLEIANKLWRAVKEEDGPKNFEATIEMIFEGEGKTGATDQLRNAEQSANADISIFARFGEERTQ